MTTECNMGSLTRWANNKEFYWDPWEILNMDSLLHKVLYPY